MPFLDEEEDGTFEDYIKTMRKSGEWGGHLAIGVQCETNDSRTNINYSSRIFSALRLRALCQYP